jgi:hypothetical protein
MSPAAIVGGSSRQIRKVVNSKESGEVRLRPNQLADSTLPRKTSRGAIRVTVPQTGTGRQGENPKARERTLAKELGKIAP